MTLPAAPDLVKVWPALLLATRERRPLYGGAARAYFIARSLDTDGRGGVDSRMVKARLRLLNVNTRTARRWVREALEVGLFKSGAGRLWMVSITRAAALFGLSETGKPAYIHPEQLVKPGWRAVSWAGRLTGFKSVVDAIPRPLSRRALKRATGVSARTQARHESRCKVIRTRTYCPRGEGNDLDAAGWRDIHGLVVFSRDGYLLQRLPDTRQVPISAAVCVPGGRSKKIRHESDSSVIVERGKADSRRRFFFTEKGKAYQAIKSQAKGERDSHDVFLYAGVSVRPAGRVYGLCGH